MSGNKRAEGRSKPRAEPSPSLSAARLLSHTAAAAAYCAHQRTNDETAAIVRGDCSGIERSHPRRCICLLRTGRRSAAPLAARAIERNGSASSAVLFLPHRSFSVDELDRFASYSDRRVARGRRRVERAGVCVVDSRVDASPPAHPPRRVRHQHNAHSAAAAWRPQHVWDTCCSFLSPCALVAPTVSPSGRTCGSRFQSPS